MLPLSQQLSTANSSSVRGGVSKVPSPSLITFGMASSYAVLMQITTATTRLFSHGECWQCHTQETAFQKMPLHPLAQRFLLIPLPCYLSLNGQRYLIKMPHLGRHSQSLRLGASLILRASRDVPFTRFISYHQVKFLKKSLTSFPTVLVALHKSNGFPRMVPGSSASILPGIWVEIKILKYCMQGPVVSVLTSPWGFPYSPKTASFYHRSHCPTDENLRKATSILFHFLKS